MRTDKGVRDWAAAGLGPFPVNARVDIRNLAGSLTIQEVLEIQERTGWGLSYIARRLCLDPRTIYLKAKARKLDVLVLADPRLVDRLREISWRVLRDRRRLEEVQKILSETC